VWAIAGPFGPAIHNEQLRTNNEELAFYSANCSSVSPSWRIISRARSASS
jgi:hypothetical protein